MTKRNLYILFLIPAIALASCKKAPQSDDTKTGESQEAASAAGSTTYTINTSASKLEWIGTKLSSYHHGVVNIKSGEIQVKDGKIAGGKFVMDMPTIVAYDKGSNEQNTKLTGHLLSDDFFATAKFPEATFEITGAKEYTGTITEGGQEEISEYKVSNPNYLISGNLKIKDITKNIEFPAQVTVNDNTVDAVTKFNIDRKEWGITYPGAPDDMIQDMIWFGISIKATK